MRIRYLPVLALAAAVTLGNTARGSAEPVLQLDILGGTYDDDTQTIVSSGTQFTLYALGTPNNQIPEAAMLADLFYLSAGLVHVGGASVIPPGGDFGYFTVNGVQINATSGMIYGTPPVELFAELQGSDPGDLSPHGVYPTYFSEFEFQFNAGNTAETYDTAEDTGAGPSPFVSRLSFFESFVIDTSNLNPDYRIHFDLYNSDVKKCGNPDRRLVGPECQDIDVAKFAPFSHDAESGGPPPVPEPATLLLMGSGLAAGAVRKYRQRRAGANAPAAI